MKFNGEIDVLLKALGKYEGGKYNLFPQDANFNNSAYKIYFENIIAKAAKEGKAVNVNARFRI
ncbi:hypothetical protein A4G16_00440 [Mannheimia granulomatis]|uniref:Uncharacterized protein n=1 Tax=Mannheimia granulomatis TaxID=85402 RepID=A0A6G8JG48_9PAST|nr:hypothetical protein [Mannheimia granulomatis]QIM65953.1 hypothetical protein A4G16_00440 [Mannheimia granulomatis]QLB18418.1 hypothetical protein A6B41_02630 [Mannheimia granulomatis]